MIGGFARVQSLILDKKITLVREDKIKIEWKITK